MLTMKVEGLEDLENQLVGLADGFRTDLVLRNTITKAVKRAMEPIATAVYEAPIPFDEKNTKYIHLRDTVRLDARIPNARDRQSDMINSTDVVIGVVSVKKSAVSLSQEFGNARVPGKPYLRQALEQNYQKAINVFVSEMSELVPNYARKLAKRKV